MNERLSQWMVQGSFIQLRGHKIFVRQGGTGPTLLLIHGFPTSSFDWHVIWPELTAHFTVIAPDMLGMGFSDKPRNHAYGLMNHVDLHEALLARLGVRGTYVVAHDLGVSVVQEMLARRSAAKALPSIEKVVLLNGGLCPEVYHPRLIQHILSSPLGPLIGPRLPRRAVERSIASLFGPQTGPSPQLLQDFWELITHNQGLGVAHLVGRFYIERLSLRNRLVAPLMSRAVPIRFINGSADPNSGRHMADAYQILVPDADIQRLPHIGHWPQIEAAQTVTASILEFLK
jgi:pimeloyl-ACP methyl ester carboxylesterase